MKTIAFVVPYFGKFPDHFQLWLNSCSCNPTIDWLIFTDDKSPFWYPDNVHVSYTSLDFIKKQAERQLGFPICLNRAYKLCDLKPAYGVVFAKELKNYDFWGFCDVDLIWGNIRKFVTEEVLQKNDRIFQWGHCSIFRNVREVNYFYNYRVDGVFDYEKVLQSELSFSYDEVCHSGKIFNTYYLDTYYKESFCYDIFVSSDMFLPSCGMPGAPFVPSLFKCFDGKVIGYTLDGKELVEKEYIYIHFQKRPMKVKLNKSLENVTQYVIVPDCFMDFIDIDVSFYKKYTRTPLFDKRAFKFKMDYYIDGIFDMKYPKMYERSRVKKIFDKIFFRHVESIF